MARLVPEKELCCDKYIMDEVEEFIKRRFDIDCHWLDGNCYYFAMILCRRFPRLHKVYLPIEGHWMATDGKRYYDFNGGREMPKETLYEEDWLIANDIDLYCQIVNDCTR